MGALKTDCILTSSKPTHFCSYPKGYLHNFIFRYLREMFTQTRTYFCEFLPCSDSESVFIFKSNMHSENTWFEKSQTNAHCCLRIVNLSTLGYPLDKFYDKFESNFSFNPLILTVALSSLKGFVVSFS